jgi:flagellar biosynthetic protein FliO
LTILAAPVTSRPNEPTGPSTKIISPLFAKDPNFTFGSDQQFGTGGLYWKMVFAIILVLALGAALYYISKKLGGKIVNISGRNIQLVETLYLGSRKAIHLIKVADKNILVGTTPTAITKISEFEVGSSTADKQIQ